VIPPVFPPRLWYDSHMPDHEPLSSQQLQQVLDDVAELADRGRNHKTMLAAYGPEDPRAVRAQKIRASIQRLQWAIVRSKGCERINPFARKGGYATRGSLLRKLPEAQRPTRFLLPTLGPLILPLADRLQ
jgi:hypothetical protein